MALDDGGDADGGKCGIFPKCGYFDWWRVV